MCTALLYDVGRCMGCGYGRWVEALLMGLCAWVSCLVETGGVARGGMRCVEVRGGRQRITLPRVSLTDRVYLSGSLGNAR